MKTQKLESALQSLEDLTDEYKVEMSEYGISEMSVKKACLLYLDKHKDCKFGIEKLEMVACSENEEIRNVYLRLVELRADRKISECAIDSFKHTISGLQSLIKFENLV
jgi:hypothetical protein